MGSNSYGRLGIGDESISFLNIPTKNNNIK